MSAKFAASAGFAGTRPFCPPARGQAGIGLRHVYYEDIARQPAVCGWLEVHPENYFGGGAPLHFLEGARQTYPLSFHAVGLSLGSARGVDRAHVLRIKSLAARFEPFLISDHASWSASGNAHLNDLLPLPYTDESLDRLVDNVSLTQDLLERRILIENPSTYLRYAVSEMEEWAWLNEAARRSGCGLLLDINNIYVQSCNHGLDPRLYIDSIEAQHVDEIHLAGHTERACEGGTLLVDTHNRPVRAEVWALYEYAISRLGPVPTLIEWDQDFPPLADLCAEARRAEAIMVPSARVADAAE